MATSGDEGYDVIIVGAGLSGLTAAYAILQKKPSARVLIIEAIDRIGGDMSSETLKSSSGSNEWDTCGSRIGSSQKEILKLLADLGMETHQQYNKGNKFWRLPDGKLKKFSGAIPPLPYTTLLDVVRYFKKVDGMQGQINMERVKDCKHAEEWDGMTVEDFLKKYLWTNIGKITIETMTRSFCNSSPSELTMMQYLYIIHTCGGWDPHINSGDKGRSDLVIKDGAMSLCRKLTDKIGEQNIAFGETVTSVTEQGGQIKLSMESGKEYRTQQVIMAIPCRLAGHVTYNPPLPLDRGRTLPKNNDLIMSLITYKSPFWREAGHTGEYLNMAASAPSNPGNVDDTLVITFDMTLPGGQPALEAFSNPAKLQGKSKEERKDIVLRLLSDVFGPQVLDCLDYTEREWVSGPVTDADRAPVSKSSELLAAVTKPHGRVHWAGSDAATAWCGTLNGAVQAGQRAADEIIATI
ncbi:amine oxidase [flavin-containing] A-like [Patiria miniata]|uniref:Amine oxidase n=1 Tax=Patiria miniata TaxID=46514 RepID=A0A913Z2Q9_PATMI|nr:amine oxidase [flavin-containing] A-like [Patiria miniata]